jgi:dihydrofolate synthase / folylpolyglutamate synthase
MIITPIKTVVVRSGTCSLLRLLDTHIEHMKNGSVLAITSKVVSLCEGSTVPIDEITKDELMIQECRYYLPGSTSKWGHSFTITQDTLIPTAGIDESNSDGCYVLWPCDSQKTANEVRQYLKKRFKLQKVGVIITDSTCTPMRRGTIGVVLAHSGFRALNNYIGKPDLFGRKFTVSQASVSGGLAASAVSVMGEGAEQTPLAMISDINFVTFCDANPTTEELSELRITKEEDLFAPFLGKVDWLQGKK